MEFIMRDTFLLSMERREARRTDSWVMLCRSPARECRSFSEHRMELRREFWAMPAIGILAADRSEDGSGFMACSADRRSDGEMLTITFGDGIFGGDGGESTSTSALSGSLSFFVSFSSGSSGFLFSTSSSLQLPWGTWLTSSDVSDFLCLFLRVVRLGWAVVLASEVEASGTGSSSAIRFSDLMEEPRRLLRLPLENLDAGGTYIFGKV